MTRRLVSSLILSLTLVLGGLLLVSGKVNGAAKLTLTATKARKAPIGLNDTVWEKTRRIKITLEGKDNFAGKKKIVSTKAVYTDDEIYFLLTWKDATKSVAKQSWQFDGEKWMPFRVPEKPCPEGFIKGVGFDV